MNPRHDPSLTLDAATAPFAPPADFPPAPGSFSGSSADAARESMESEWADGNPVPAEWYLSRVPELAADEESALDLAYLEFVLRQEAGHEADVDSFAGRFPALRNRLHSLFALDSALRVNAADAMAETATTDRTRDTARPAPATPLGNLGRYLLVSELGGGGQADVFLALHPTLGREVVVKRLRLGERGAGAAERLRAEGRTLAGLDHPNLAKVYDLDVADGRPFMVMELIRGRSLHEVRKHAPVPPADAAKWVAAVARAAHHAHGRGVLHLDIKPRNVVLEETGRAVLLDFGLAKLDHGVEQSPDAGVSGTLAYMPPEQARGQNDRLGPPTDVYGLGGVLFYLLTGHDPIIGKTASEVFARAQEGNWDRQALADSGAPARLARVCEKAMSSNPAERYPSADAFADAVDAAVRLSRLPWVAGGIAALAAVVALTVTFWPNGTPVNPKPPVAGPQQPAETPKPELKLTFDVYRRAAGKFFDLSVDSANPPTLAEQGRVRATIPAKQYATLLLATENGAVKQLDARQPADAEQPFAHPASADPKKTPTLKFTGEGGTHVFILATSPTGPLSAEALGLTAEAWPRLPAESVLRLSNGKAVVVVKGRDVEMGGVVADPEGEILARLTKLAASAPKDATVEAIAFAVKQ